MANSLVLNGSATALLANGLAGQDERIKLTVTRDHYDYVRKPPDPNDDRALIPPLDLVVRSKWPNAAVDWNDTEPIL